MPVGRPDGVALPLTSAPAFHRPITRPISQSRNSRCDTARRRHPTAAARTGAPDPETAAPGPRRRPMLATGRSPPEGGLFPVTEHGWQRGHQETMNIRLIGLGDVGQEV